MKSLVINELRMYARVLRGYGLKVKVIGKTNATYGEDKWIWSAKAWNEGQKSWNYLLVERTLS